MDSKTGEIFQLTDKQEQTLRNKIGDRLVNIPKEEVENVTKMNRAQRRAWAKNKKKGK